MIRIREIDHLVLRVVDLNRMLRFYCDVLGCTIERRQDSIGLVQLRAGRSLVDNFLKMTSHWAVPAGRRRAQKGEIWITFAFGLSRSTKPAFAGCSRRMASRRARPSLVTALRERVRPSTSRTRKATSSSSKDRRRLMSFRPWHARGRCG